MYTKILKTLLIIPSSMVFPIDHILGQSTEIEHYYQQGLKHKFENIDSAKYYFRFVDSIGYEEKDSFMIFESAKFLCGYYQLKENNEKSRKYINRALPYVNRSIDSVTLLNTLTYLIKEYDPKTTDSIFLKTIHLALNESSSEITSIYNNYGHILHRKGDLGKAAFYFQQAIESSEIDFTKFQVYLSLLNIFEALGNKSLTKEYLDKAIHIAEKNDYKSRNGIISLHYAKYLISVNQIKEAKIEIDKAIAYEIKIRPSAFEIAKVITLTKYYSVTKEWELLQKYLDERQNIFEKHKIENLPTILYTRAQCAFQIKDFALSEKWALQTLQESENNNIKHGELNAISLLAKIYTQQNKLKKANKYLALSKKISDAYFHNTQAQNFIYLEAAYNRKEQKLAIDELNQENIIKEENLARKNIFLKLGAFILTLFAVFTLILFKFYNKVKSQKEIISKALKEKDLLLKEIHHRVKNNLQLVSSLLTMQGRSINDETAIQAINEGKSRVRSMAIIHQDLYNKDNLTGISVKSYIEKLTKELFSTYRIDDNKLDLKIDIDDIEMDIDTIVPLGLIINELITNSLKYAWPDDNEGTLLIELKRTKSKIVLIVKDDGIGYDPTSVREGSFGSTLISALTLQLEGECTVNIDNGCTIIITLDNNSN